MRRIGLGIIGIFLFVFCLIVQGADFSYSGIGTQNIKLNSGGKSFSLNGHPWTAISTEKGGIFFAAYGVEGVYGKINLHCWKILSSGMVVDDDNVKTIKVVYSLAWMTKEEGKEVWKEYSSLTLEVEATIKKDIPALFITSCLHNEGEEISSIGNTVWIFWCNKFESQFVYGGEKEEQMLPKIWSTIPSRNWYYFTKEKNSQEGIGIIIKSGHLGHAPEGIIHYYWGSKKLGKGEKSELGSFIFVPVDKGLSYMKDIFDLIKLKETKSITESVDSLLLQNKYPVTLFSKPPIIDGDLSDWEGIPSINIDRVEQMVPLSTAPYGGENDLSAKVYLGYDRDNLYFAALVKDDVFYQVESGANVYNGDNIQIAFDTLCNKSPSYDSDDYEYGLSLTPKGPEVWCWYAAKGNSTGLIEDISLAVKRNEVKRITYYEASIPWKRLSPFQIHFGKMGFSVLINDNDKGGRVRYMGWKGFESIGGGSKNTSNFGELVFQGVEKVLATEAISFFLSSLDSCESGENVPITVTLYSPKSISDATISLEVRNEKGEVLYKIPKEVILSQGLNRFSFSIDTTGYEGGRYFLVGYVKAEENVFPSQPISIEIYNPKSIIEKLNKAKEVKEELERIVSQAKEKGLTLPYVEAKFFLLKDFIDYTKEYMERKSIYLWAEKRTLDLTKGRIRLDRLAQADRNANWLLKVGKEALEEAKYLISHPDKIKLVPEYDLKRKNIILKDGAIYCNGKPVLLIGMCDATHIFGKEDYASKLKPYGFNYVQSFHYITSMNKDNDYAKDYVQTRLEMAKKYNIAWTMKLEPYLYNWGKKPIPEPGSSDDEFFKEVYSGVMRWLKDGEYLFSISLINEPSMVRYDESAQKSFREYLKRKYKTIKELNLSWGTEFNSFEEITCKQEDKGKNIAKWLDWMTFTFQRTSNFFRYMQSLVHKGDPNVWTHQMYMTGGWWWGAYDEIMGVDYEDTTDFLEIKDMDSYSLYPSHDEFSYYFMARLPAYDLIRSMKLEKVMIDDEYHIIKDSDPSYYPYQYCYTALFQGFLHGIRGCALWVWDRSESTHDLGNNFYTRAEATDALSKCALDLRRLAPYIIPFSQEKSEVAIFYSIPSIPSTDYLSCLRDVYLGLLFLNKPIWFVTERQILMDKLKDYKVLIIPHAQRTSKDVLEKIITFAKGNGKKVVLIGEDCLSQNESGHKQESSLLNLFYSLPSIIKIPQSTPLFYAKKFAEMYVEMGIKPLVKTVDNKGDFIWGIESQSVKKEGKIITYLINLNKKDTLVNLITGEGNQIRKAKDLIDEKEITFPYLLKPMEILLLELEK